SPSLARRAFSGGGGNPISVAVEVARSVIVTTLAILIVSITVTIIIPIVVAIPKIIGELAICLSVSFQEALTVIGIASLLVANRACRIVAEMRQGVPLTCDPPVLDSSSIFDFLPAAVYTPVVVTVRPVLREGD